ncbi:MAG: hypothetical protein IK028_01915 [Bacilli bacterium]|nr:hypothetical protein [Bacilli bacterium]
MNDIEKKLRKRGMQKLDKFAHNPYHVNKPSFFSKIPLWTKIAVPAFAMTAVTIVAFVGLISGRGAPTNSANKPSRTAQSEAGYSYTDASNSVDKGLSQSGEPAAQGHSFSINGQHFDFLARQYKDGGEQGGHMFSTIQEENIGNSIGEATYEDLGETISLYEIKNYSSDVFLAAKLPSDPKYYACCNIDSTFSTINDFLNKIPFLSDSSIENSKITVFEDLPKNAIYKNADTETINSYLFTNTGSASNTTSFRPAPGENYIIMPFTLNTFDNECVTIVLYRGYMQIKVGFDSANDNNVYEVGTDIYTTVETYVKTLTKVNG